MSQNLFLDLPTPVTLALQALIVILLPVARVLVALHKPAPVRIPGVHPGAQARAHADPSPRQGQR